MSKRLVICCDGTWNKLDADRPTNVVKTARAIAQRDSAGTAQIVFYDDGVGTGEGRTPRLDRILGGAFGWGLDRNIEDAYRFLVFNHEPGDEIFIFGFSRGAYTARSLAGLIRKCGILGRGEAHRAPEAVAYYRDRETKPQRPVAGVIPGWGSAVEIKFLGVWDTVGALGIPSHLLVSKLFNRRYAFHDTELSGIVKNAVHAVAIDEQRAAFAVTLWERIDKPGQTIEQVWFPGDHRSVGGGGPERGLSDGAFLWMMEKAQSCGIAIDEDCVEKAKAAVDPLARFDNSLAKNGIILGALYRLIGRRDRPSPPTVASIHRSAVTRWQRDRLYRPRPLAPHAGALGAESTPPTPTGRVSTAPIA